MVNLSAIRVGPVRYNSPWTQVIILGFVTFCSVGMFSAVSNLGAGGTMDTQLSDIANSVLYAVFAITGFFAGSINNVLGPRLTLSLGTTGYSLYIGSLWCFQKNGTRWFLILAGGILGFTAALLWAAQGAIMMSYPLEKDKGRSFSLFWSIFQLGTLVGSAIALGIEAHSTLPSVSTGVYLAFMIIMLTAIVTSWLLLPPHLVVRGDGTVPLLEDSISPRRELHEFVQLFKDWRMLALFPMFFSSNYFYAYQGAITAFLFNGRTRALTALLTGLGSIVGSILIGFVTDRLPFGRRARALGGVVAVLLMNILIWCAGIGFQVKFTRADEVILGDKRPWDWSVHAAAGPIVLLMAYYIADAMYQGLAYYTMSAMSNDPFKLARMAGYYKGVQSAGSAVSFGMDAVKTAFLGEILISWLMLLISLPLCAWVLMTIRETNYEVEGTARVETMLEEKNIAHEHKNTPEEKTEAIAMPEGQGGPKMDNVV
ncbi:major facilitator superfamily domain-containing protein [Exophiala viscosa]|uniref:major facilitator superfamily domain-containing protein n=1 Tax=Exophiala viscosa TaxID=2486360 RepID=UPI0021A22826|nr:major facilitator superfamily domain-containing protein [Exophiala viscosa]